MGAPERKSAPSLVVSVQVLAELLDVTPRWARQIGVRVGRDRFDAVASLRKVRTLEAETGNGDDTLVEARRRYWSAKSRVMEIEARRAEQSVIDSDELEQFFHSLIITFRSRLLHQPRRVSLELAPEDPKRAERVLDRDVREILEELAAAATLEEVLARIGGSPGRKEESHVEQIVP